MKSCLIIAQIRCNLRVSNSPIHNLVVTGMQQAVEYHVYWCDSGMVATYVLVRTTSVTCTFYFLCISHFFNLEINQLKLSLQNPIAMGVTCFHAFVQNMRLGVTHLHVLVQNSRWYLVNVSPCPCAKQPMKRCNIPPCHCARQPMKPGVTYFHVFVQSSQWNLV